MLSTLYLRKITCGWNNCGTMNAHKVQDIGLPSFLVCQVQLLVVTHFHFVACVFSMFLTEMCMIIFQNCLKYFCYLFESGKIFFICGQTSVNFWCLFSYSLYVTYYVCVKYELFQVYEESLTEIYEQVCIWLVCKTENAVIPHFI